MYFITTNYTKKMITNRLIVDCTYFATNFYNFYNYGGMHFYPMLIFIISMYCNHILARQNENLQFEYEEYFQYNKAIKKQVDIKLDVPVIQFKLMTIGWWMTIVLTTIQHAPFWNSLSTYYQIFFVFFIITYLYSILRRIWNYLALGPHLCEYMFFY